MSVQSAGDCLPRSPQMKMIIIDSPMKGGGIKNGRKKLEEWVCLATERDV